MHPFTKRVLEVAKANPPIKQNRANISVKKVVGSKGKGTGFKSVRMEMS